VFRFERARAVSTISVLVLLLLAGCKNTLVGTVPTTPSASPTPVFLAPTPPLSPPVAASPHSAWNVPSPTAAPLSPSQSPSVPGNNTPALGKNKQCGEASYYADSLAGGATASGQPYQPTALTAAHLSLPLGTKATVTLQNNSAKKVTLVVNDRGPYTPGRILDLSRAAFERLGSTSAGILDVCIYWD
jgi:rare lipoprotein A